MTKLHNILFVTLILPIVALPVDNLLADIDSSFYEWQTDRLFAPSDFDVLMENNGYIFIYSGIKDVDVELALDQQYARIESMMFVNTVVTDGNGSIVKNPDTGEIETEDDC
ncbi:MAG: hypothetical protein ACC707_03245 [Thiohalomonadales bacterium]